MTSSPSAFAVRDFRLLWLGETISSLGDQFALVGLPWLALVLTGSALVDRPNNAEADPTFNVAKRCRRA